MNRRAVLSRMLLAVLAVAIALLAGELWARWAWPKLPERPVLPVEYATLPALKHISELAQPNQRGVFNGALHETNGLGLRSDEHSLETPPGTFRIATIGDSFVMGEGVPEDEIYTNLVERFLNEGANDGVSYEVINLGLSGINLASSVDRLQTIGLSFHPDLVIYGFTINDVEGPSYRHVDESTGPIFPVFPPPSRLYGLVRARLAGLRELLSPPRGSYLYELDRNYFDNPPAWQDFLSAMDRLHEVTRQEEVCTVVFVHTHLFHLNRFHPFRRHYEAVSAAARERGFHVIQSLPYFVGHDINKLWLHLADSHPNAKGHALLADALREGLEGLPSECSAKRY